MAVTYLQMGEAQRYLRERYNITWSRPTIVKMLHEHKISGYQRGPRGWWYIERESIDRLLKPSRTAD